MNIKTKDKILEILKKREQVTIADLSDILGISRQIIHRHLSDLSEQEKIKKQGTPPKVFYMLNNIKEDVEKYDIRKDLNELIEHNFFLINPSGKRIEGVEGFVEWCRKRGFNIEEKAEEYCEILERFSKYKKDGFVSGMYKMKNTFDKVFLDEVYYLDFYSIEVFGKTKLGQMVLYAKQSQDKKLIREVVHVVKEKVNKLVHEKKVDAVGFVPPSVKREVQFVREIEKGLNLSLPKIDLLKVQGDVVVPQKTLSKLEDRIENSRQIKLVIGREVRKHNTVLLIDDALGSGATLNEIARQIKTQKVSEKVIGLTITGSYSGFETISEV